MKPLFTNIIKHEHILESLWYKVCGIGMRENAISLHITNSILLKKDTYISTYTPVKYILYDTKYQRENNTKISTFYTRKYFQKKLTTKSVLPT